MAHAYRIHWSYLVAQHPNNGLTEQVSWPLEDSIAGPTRPQYLEGLRQNSAEGFIFSEPASNTWCCSSHSQELRGRNKVVLLNIVPTDTQAKLRILHTGVTPPIDTAVIPLNQDEGFMPQCFISSCLRMDEQK